MILGCIHCSRWHELPHGNPRVTNERHHLVAMGLALSSKCSRNCRRGWHEARLRSHCLQLLLQLLFLWFQPLLLITKFSLLCLHMWTNSFAKFRVQLLTSNCPKTCNQNKQRFTFNSLIFSWRLEFESFNFWASPRNWFTIRTASIKIAALSVLGGLPGSNIEPNSTNL